MNIEETGFLEPNEHNEINISAQKRSVKSAGWLASFRPYDDLHEYESFTTASAAKAWLVEKFNEYTSSDRKRLPWVKNSDLHFSADCVFNEKTGKTNFRKA